MVYLWAGGKVPASGPSFCQTLENFKEIVVHQERVTVSTLVCLPALGPAVPLQPQVPRRQLLQLQLPARGGRERAEGGCRHHRTHFGRD